MHKEFFMCNVGFEPTNPLVAATGATGGLTMNYTPGRCRLNMRVGNAGLEPTTSSV